MKKNKIILAAPVLKWVGGKRQLMSEIEKVLPKTYTTYYEPFIGGGAVLFELQPKKAVINDVNGELINLYNVIKDDVELLIEDLKKHENTPEYFYSIRELDRKKDKYENLSNVEKASRIVYLNKTCFNGLFRVNKAGEFNSPFGKYKNPNIVDEVTLRAVSKYFNKADIKILNGDFEASLKGIRKGAFVYLDPPYDPVSNSANFTGYDKGGFNRDEQIRLKKLCDKLDKKGVKFLLSNSATDFIKDLYKDYNIKIVKAKRAINSNGNARGEVDEVLVRNYE
ncbi:DNA adenine methylase [Clostridium perfringens]|uniref:Site-specific DNA-methyltransferase (adenine-specific) n=1 Tax=Clostridium perfringens E str. JGS1987 TaxID=451755 RepID=B1BX96_CLOPF|nr:DNA adenine methylase [Clostridium perfringens]EDT13665.1 modification methylase lladchia [Clostridium perfringens E str. JGS1987]EHK2346829.1 DNA adenine methylase [Clostridium perfringens]EIF2087525.1 DNA adenine methylase [Clostridium perfringens]EIF2808111.1 DNA adenine methylase [Clostridium perfringens]EIF6155176.1 DNA adenine methylase [Clostridium perfringens]